MQLSYGYAMTIHTAQGITTPEHISVFPAGSQAVNGGLGYSSLTRQTQRVYLVTNEVAERNGVRQRRPLNDTREITTDDKWAQVARALSYQPVKDTALAMVDRVTSLRRGTVRTFRDVAQQVARGSRSIGPDAGLRHGQERSLTSDLREFVQRTVEAARRVVTRGRSVTPEGPAGLSR